jgi:alpha-D-xyloside xylohydrolase
VQTCPVYLPQGVDWYDFRTEERRQGGRWIRQEISIDHLPVYVKAGSIIPFGPEVQYAEEKDWSVLELRSYPGADAVFTLYEDEKENYNYEKGAYSVIEIRWDDARQALTIGKRQGKFPGMLKERTFRIRWAGSEKEQTVRYKGEAMTLLW